MPIVCLALQEFLKSWATDMAAARLDELVGSRRIGDAKGEEEPRQRKGAGGLRAKRPGDSEAHNAGEGREHVPLQIHGRQLSELLELAFESILSPDRHKWLEPLPDALQIEQIDVGQVKGLGWHTTKWRARSLVLGASQDLGGHVGMVQHQGFEL